MDKIQKFLVTAGRKDLAQEYYEKNAYKKISSNIKELKFDQLISELENELNKLKSEGKSIAYGDDGEYDLNEILVKSWINFIERVKSYRNNFNNLENIKFHYIDNCDEANSEFRRELREMDNKYTKNFRQAKGILFSSSGGFAGIMPNFSLPEGYIDYDIHENSPAFIMV